MARMAFLFPGQGAQSVGMGGALCEALPAARQLFDQAADVLGYDLLAVCATGPKEKLDSTVVSQPAIYVASLAALEHLKQTEPEAVADCVACAGLSLGEYTALTFAGALTFADGLRLVQKRGEAMQAAADARAGGMVSILLLEQPRVEEIVQAASSEGAGAHRNLPLSGEPGGFRRGRRPARKWRNWPESPGAHDPPGGGRGLSHADDAAGRRGADRGAGGGESAAAARTGVGAT